MITQKTDEIINMNCIKPDTHDKLLLLTLASAPDDTPAIVIKNMANAYFVSIAKLFSEKA